MGTDLRTARQRPGVRGVELRDSVVECGGLTPLSRMRAARFSLRTFVLRTQRCRALALPTALHDAAARLGTCLNFA